MVKLGVALKVVAGLTGCAPGMTPMDLICWDVGFMVERLRSPGSMNGKVLAELWFVCVNCGIWIRNGMKLIVSMDSGG